MPFTHMPGNYNNQMQSGVDGNQSSFLGDLNADGILDMLWIWDGVGNSAQSGTAAWLGNGDGTFNHTPITDKGGFTGIVTYANNIIQAGISANESTYLIDANGDGKLDVLWLADGEGSPADSGTWVWTGNGDGTFAHVPIIDKGNFTGIIYGANNLIQAGYTANESTHVADVNGDGKMDIIGIYDVFSASPTIICEVK